MTREELTGFTQRKAGMTQAMTLLFTVAGAAAVGNLYWAQPLLTEIAADLNISLGQSGTLVTLTQLGYASGVLLLVPLGDSLNRRRFIPALMGLSVAALIATALAPAYPALLGSLAAVGLTSLSGQLLVPLAGDLALDDQRGRVIGTIASGLLIGIMLSRFVSGLVADAFGWRAIYALAAVLNVMFGVLLLRKLPDDKPRPSLPYGQLLVSIAAGVQSSPPVQVTLVLGACAFAVFTMFWTGLTFLLRSPVFSFSVTQIGMVNLIGLVGAFAAQRAGRLHDRGWSTRATGGALILAFVTLATAALGGASLVIVCLAILLINLSIQTINVLSTTIPLTLPSSRWITLKHIETSLFFCLAYRGRLWQTGGCLRGSRRPPDPERRSLFPRAIPVAEKGKRHAKPDRFCHPTSAEASGEQPEAGEPARRRRPRDWPPSPGSKTHAEARDCRLDGSAMA